ncbi:SAF domain-containing protein [Kitasatospora sp. NPDC097643]|uniref:SAF domain-containing protein n=1 Tax=Kitasatospora sp. NPDC097643 TaxID=3157230 RepID=UPI00331B5524
MENRTFATPGTGTPAGAAVSVAVPEQGAGQSQGRGPGRRGKGGGKAGAKAAGAGEGGAAPHTPGRNLRARRRRPAVLAMAVALIAAGGLGGAVLYNSTGQRVAVLALARDVPWGQVITEDDLVVARIATDPALRPVSAKDRAGAVGMRAATDLKRGAMLTRTDLAQTLTVQPGQIMVGVSAKRTQLPATRLAPGLQIVVVYTPDNAKAESMAATVITVGRVDTDGSQVIDVAVGAADGPRLAGWVASARIQVLLAPRAAGAAAPTAGPSGTPSAVPSGAATGAPSGAATGTAAPSGAAPGAGGA